jgi:hypothetical protein
VDVTGEAGLASALGDAVAVVEADPRTVGRDIAKRLRAEPDEKSTPELEPGFQSRQ